MAATALLCGWAAPAAQASASAGGGLHADPAEGAALDLTGAALGQQARNLVLTVQAAAPIDPEQLSAAAGGELCARFEPADGAALRLCVTRSDTAWQLRVGARTVVGSVGQPTAGRLAIRVEPAALGLAPGPLRWRVYARAASCGATGARSALNGGVSPDDGTATPTSPTPALPPAASCVDRVPDSGSFAGRVWRTVVTGCTATGPAQVLSGPRGKRIALTYDDGPAADTPAFVDELHRLGVPATFFMIGRQVQAEPALARRVLAAGDAIGNHSWDHANLGAGGPAATDELVRTNAAIRRATGFTPCLFRPPYRATGADLVARVRAQGMTSVLWSVDPADWATPGTGVIVGRVLAQTGPGAIILDHDGGGNRSQTLAAIPQMVAALRARGYTFVTVPELLGYDVRLTLKR
ncbi:MAG TPA: polysaccharide deacetylase family protein [Solirubrobacteraceae bacterium]